MENREFQLVEHNNGSYYTILMSKNGEEFKELKEESETRIIYTDKDLAFKEIKRTFSKCNLHELNECFVMRLD